jgi:hypothetical protein
LRFFFSIELQPLGPAVPLHASILVQFHSLRGVVDWEGVSQHPRLVADYVLGGEPAYVIPGELATQSLAAGTDQVDTTPHSVPVGVESGQQTLVGRCCSLLRGDKKQGSGLTFEIGGTYGFTCA